MEEQGDVLLEIKTDELVRRVLCYQDARREERCSKKRQIGVWMLYVSEIV